jgi:uncharacterized CHY-type Zn-finger protein
MKEFFRMAEIQDYLKCPFCENQWAEPKSGKTKCFECSSEFEFDDRLECVFVNTEKLRLPAKGIVCPVCGLIQNDDVKTCLYCGMPINSNVQ